MIRTSTPSDVRKLSPIQTISDGINIDVNKQESDAATASALDPSLALD
jgi:hypothetical protein